MPARCGALSLQSRVYKRMRIQLRKLASNGSSFPGVDRRRDYVCLTMSYAHHHFWNFSQVDGKFYDQC